MKNIYLDTAIIISYIKKDDIFYPLSKKIMDSNIINRIGSTITVIEISSVISRQFNNLEFSETKISNWNELNLVEKKSLIISYFLNILPIKFYYCSGSEKFKIQEKWIEFHLSFSKVYRIAPFFSLKTLDNLQIASALNIKEIRNVDIDYFVTTDETILNQAKKIQEMTDLTILHPKDLIKIEHID